MNQRHRQCIVKWLIWPYNKVHHCLSTHDAKGRREMVIEKVRVIDEKRMSAWATGFVKHCTWCKLERGRREKPQLAKPSSHRTTANELPPGSTYYFLSAIAGTTAFYPLKSVAVAWSLYQPCSRAQEMASFKSKALHLSYPVKLWGK